LLFPVHLCFETNLNLNVTSIKFLGDQKGHGGTTSNLRLVGFGTRASAEVIIENEAELRQVPSKTLMQCHFKVGFLIYRFLGLKSKLNILK
jgi:hypothetical protein